MDGEIGEDPGDAVLVHAADEDAAGFAAGRGWGIEADDDPDEGRPFARSGGAARFLEQVAGPQGAGEVFEHYAVQLLAAQAGAAVGFVHGGR